MTEKEVIQIGGISGERWVGWGFVKHRSVINLVLVLRWVRLDLYLVQQKSNKKVSVLVSCTRDGFRSTM